MKRRLPVLFLFGSLALASLGALDAHRSMKNHRASAEGILTDYGTFAAWTYERALADLVKISLENTFEPLWASALWRGGAIPCPSEIADQQPDAECSCLPPLNGAYGFRVILQPDRDLTPVERAYRETALPRDIHEGKEIVFTGRGPSEHDQEKLAEMIRWHAAEELPEGWKYSVVDPSDHGMVGRPLAYTVVEIPGFGPTAFGVEMHEDRLRSLMAKAMVEESLLPPSLGLGTANQYMLAIEVRTPSDRLLYSSGSEPDARFAATEHLPATLGGLQVRAAVLPDVADKLVIGGLPRSRMPFLLALFGLAGALALIAVGQLRREDELARLRSDFVASVSHELRTPLAQIRLYLDTLRFGRTRTPEERSWAIDNVDRETTRLMHLVENILHFSWTERSGRETRAKEYVELRELVDDVVQSFKPLAKSRRTRIENQVPRELAARVHRDSIRQVVLNLLDNAVKYGPAGQVVRISARGDGDRVRLAVDDQGRGVPPEERETIWEAFRRGRYAVGTVVAGSGIGLSVVREIVRRHDGAVSVEDAPGGGARFVVELPGKAGVTSERRPSPRPAHAAV